MQRAQLVPIGIEHIGKVERAHRAGARARRVFDRLATGGNSGIMERLHLFQTVAGKAERRPRWRRSQARR